MDTLFRTIISPEAAADMAALHAYIAQDSSDTAAKWLMILIAIEKLETIPHRTVLSRQSRNIKFPAGTLSVPPYVIYFRAIDSEKNRAHPQNSTRRERRPRHFK